MEVQQLIQVVNDRAPLAVVVFLLVRAVVGLPTWGIAMIDLLREFDDWRNDRRK